MITKNEVATALIGNELVYGMISKGHAKAEYAAEKSEVFASAFADWAEGKNSEYCDAALKFYAIEFGNHFRPGFTLTPQFLIERIELVLPHLCVNAEGSAPKQEKKPSKPKPKAKPKAKSEQEVPEKWDSQSDSGATSVILTRDSKVADINELHKSAKRAYAREGLDTVGDLLDYQQIAGLEEVNGVGTEWADETRDLIKHLSD
jgi:hypothetical protein